MSRLGSIPRRAWEVLGSMHFAVAILTIVAVAATAGSLVEQNPTRAASVSHHATLLTDVFALLRVTDVYHAGWFLSLLVFLALSTSICVWRNAPAMVREMRTFKSRFSAAQVLRLPFACKLPGVHWDSRRITLILREAGYSVRDQSALEGVHLSARKGMGRRLGYLLTHVAVPLICIGGLVDANPLVLWHLKSGDLIPLAFQAASSSPQEESKAVFDSGAFRGAVRLAPGEAASTISVSAGDGYLLRRIPYQLRLDSFEILYHPNGQPRDFVSRVTVLAADGKEPLRTVRVSMNAPAQHDGVAIYQSGFGYEGTRVAGELLATGGLAGAAFDGTIGQGVPMLVGGEGARVELLDYRPKNVLPRQERTGASVMAAFLTGPQRAETEDLGPSVELAVRDAAGQAREMTSYVRPLAIGTRAFWITGVPDPAGATKYVRVPLDASGSTRAYKALLATLADRAQHARWAEAVAQEMAGTAHREVVRAAVESALVQFMQGGLDAVGALGGTGEDTWRAALLQKLLSHAALIAYRQVEPRAPEAQAATFAADTLAAYTDWVQAGRPPLVRVDAVHESPGSVLQISHAPGADLVYLGMGLLCFGVFLMVQQRERRFWVRGQPGGGLAIGFLPRTRTPECKGEFDNVVAAIAARGIS